MSYTLRTTISNFVMQTCKMGSFKAGPEKEVLARMGRPVAVTSHNEVKLVSMSPECFELLVSKFNKMGVDIQKLMEEYENTSASKGVDKRDKAA